MQQFLNAVRGDRQDKPQLQAMYVRCVHRDRSGSSQKQDQRKGGPNQQQWLMP